MTPFSWLLKSIKKTKQNKKRTKKKYSVPSQATMLKRELNFPETLEPENKAPTVYARKVKQKAKLHAQDQLKQKNGKINQCMGNTQKWPSNDQPTA